MFFFSVFTLPHTNFPSLQFNPRALILLLSKDEQLMISVILLFLSRPNCHVFHSKPFKFSISFRSVVYSIFSQRKSGSPEMKNYLICVFLRSTITFCVFGSTKSFQFIYYHHHLFFFTLDSDFESEKLEK